MTYKEFFFFEKSTYEDPKLLEQESQDLEARAEQEVNGNKTMKHCKKFHQKKKKFVKSY